MAGFQRKSNIYHTRKWKELRLLVLERDQYRCVQCGKAARFEVDHIEPVRTGGDEFALSNLQTLCRRCHFQKTASENAHRPKKDATLNKWYEHLNTLKTKL